MFKNLFSEPKIKKIQSCVTNKYIKTITSEETLVSEIKSQIKKRKENNSSEPFFILFKTHNKLQQITIEQNKSGIFKSTVREL